MASKALIATAVLSCALVLSGCSGDTQPKEPPKSSTPSPVATAPAMPSEAGEASEEGAVAFVKHYIELLNYAANTGDVKPLQQASDPKCEGCNSYIDLYEETYAKGGYFEADQWDVGKTISDVQKDELLVFVSAESTGGAFKIDSGSAVEQSRDATYELIFAPVYAKGDWRVARFARQDGE